MTALHARAQQDFLYDLGRANDRINFNVNEFRDALQSVEFAPVYVALYAIWCRHPKADLALLTKAIERSLARSLELELDACPDDFSIEQPRAVPLCVDGLVEELVKP